LPSAPPLTIALPPSAAGLIVLEKLADPCISDATQAVFIIQWHS
jgi:hypothetical protein